jgi:hypothetical protein
MSESGSDHFLDLEEEASKVSSPEEREVSPPEGGLSDVSIPEVIQSGGGRVGGAFIGRKLPEGL